MVCAVWDAVLARFVPGCEQLLQRGHIYETNSDRVKAFRKEALSLMLVRHDFRCGSCAARSKCKFFALVREYGAKKPKNELSFPAPVETPHLIYDAGKCILCQRCVGVSREKLAVHNRADRAVTVCEMKFSERPYVITKSEWDKIEERLNVVQQHFKRKTLFFAMVTTNGLAKNKYSINYVQQEITLDDFF